MAAVSLLLATLSAGHRYFACEKMGEAALSACCPQHGADAEPSISRDACCHARQFASPDAGFAQAARGVMAAPLVATTAVPTLVLVGERGLRTPNLGWARAGPARSSPQDYRIRLRVSLT